VLTGCCGLPPDDNLSPKGNAELHSNTIWYVRDFVPAHIEEIGKVQMSFLLMEQPVSYIRYPKCTAILNLGSVVINEFWMSLPWDPSASGRELKYSMPRVNLATV